MITIRKATYWNGRMGKATACVNKFADGRAAFKHGSYDFMVYQTEADAIRAFDEFMQGKDAA